MDCLDDGWIDRSLSDSFHFQYDLVDYHANGQRLWSLWTNSDNVPVIRVTNFKSANSAWSDVVLEEGVDPCFSPSLKADARQAYMHKIFRPGRFSLQTLTKSVGVS